MSDSSASRLIPPASLTRESASFLPAELCRRVQYTIDDLEAPAFVRAVLLTLLDLTDPRLGGKTTVTLFEIQHHLEKIRDLYLSDRLIKQAVKVLVETHGIAIGSARGAEHGYYFVTTDEQAQKAVKPLLGEIRSLVVRCRALSPKSRYIQHLLGQTEVL